MSGRKQYCVWLYFDKVKGVGKAACGAVCKKCGKRNARLFKIMIYFATQAILAGMPFRGPCGLLRSIPEAPNLLDWNLSDDNHSYVSLESMLIISILIIIYALYNINVNNWQYHLDNPTVIPCSFSSILQVLEHYKYLVAK